MYCKTQFQAKDFSTFLNLQDFVSDLIPQQIATIKHG